MKRFVIEGVLTLALVSGCALLMGCETDPGKGKEQPAVNTPSAAPPTAPVAPAAPPPAPIPPGAQTFSVTPDGSSIEFTGSKVTGKHEVKVKEFQGTIAVVDGDPTKSSVNVDLTMASLESAPPKFVKHLKSPDLLDIEKFPKATFESTAITAGGANGATHTVTGNFTLHGQTKAISFPATIVTAADRVTVKAEFSVDRRDFGVVYPGMPDDLIKDLVQVRLSIDAKKS